MLLGNGDGTFQPARSTRRDLIQSSIVAGDFNGDGKLDLAVDCDNCLPTGACRSFWATATARSSPRSVRVGSRRRWRIVAGDFNGDGNLDLAVVDRRVLRRRCPILLGNGNGTFQPAVPYAVGRVRSRSWPATSTATASTDLAVGNSTRTMTSRCCWAIGDGTFADASQFATTPTGHAPGRRRQRRRHRRCPGRRWQPAISSIARAFPAQPGSFLPPVTVNPGYPSRDIARCRPLRGTPVLASVDAQDDASRSTPGATGHSFGSGRSRPASSRRRSSRPT